jgi:TPR repeat protein/CHAT domain-containing protein
MLSAILFMIITFHVIKHFHIKIIKLIPLFIVILSSLITSSTLADDAPEWYLNAYKSYEKSDYKQAVHWYKKGAEQGYAFAQYNLGLMYDNGEGVTQSFEQAVHWYTQAAEQGDAAAQYDLGVRYENGEGVTQNFEQAVRWYTQAADQGDDRAVNSLGAMYHKGYGVDKKLEKALNFYNKGVELGNKFSQYNLGMMYFNGEGVEPDLLKAFTLVKLAAEQGHNAATYNVGSFYHSGLGVEKNLDQALHWYRKSADLGDPDGQFWLGVFYEVGEVVSKDLEQAMYWYENASAQEHTNSLGSLATLYMIKGDLKKSEKTFERFIESINHDSHESVEYYDAYFVQYITLSIKQKKLKKAEQLIEFHFLQLNKFKKNTYKAHYNKFTLYNNINKLELSRVSLLEAIKLAPTDTLKLELTSEYKEHFDSIIDSNLKPVRTSQNQHNKFTESYEAQLNHYLDKFWDGFDEKDLDKLQTFVNTPKIITLNDGSAFLNALEGLVSYFEFIGNYKQSAFYARRALENLKQGYYYELHEEKKIKFQNIAAFDDDFEKAIAFVNDYSKLIFSTENSYSNPELDKKLLKGNTLFKFGYTDKARDIYEQVFAMFLGGIKTYGTCDDYFILNINLISELWSSDEFLNLMLSFDNTMDIATAKYGKKFVTDSCKNNLVSFNDALLKNIESSQFSKSDKLLNLIISNHQRLELQTRQNNLDSAIKINTSKNTPIHNQLKEYYDAQIKYEKVVANYHLEIQGRVENSVINSMVTEISEKHDQVVNSKNRLIALSPNWQSNFGQSSVNLSRIQGKINSDDLVMMLVSHSDAITDSEYSYLIAITKSSSKLHKIELSRNKINELTNNISNTLNQDKIASILDIKPYAIKDAYQLYKDILEPMKQSIEKSKRLLIIQTEVMNEIPWTILPKKIPKKVINSALDFAEYRKISWFAENKEVIYLPSLSLFSIDHSENSQALVGPAFGMSPYTTESKSETDESTIIARTVVKLESFSQLWNKLVFQGAMTEDDLEKLPLLPGTQNQINSMLDKLSSKKLFGLKATKNNIISELNKDYGTLAFATHALVSGPFKKNPGLVVRSEISGEYDLLTVSDIIFQDIKADWVLLMACNTASPGVGGIRGIADAFIYAGAKRLLISNWSIEVSVSEKFANHVKNSPFNHSFSKQVADAKKKMRTDKNNIIYAHPMFWGAFSIMGHL